LTAYAIELLFERLLSPPGHPGGHGGTFETGELVLVERSAGRMLQLHALAC
jgi:hypothetical protein